MRFLDFLKPDLVTISESLSECFPLLQNKKILITGATGYFGKWVLYSLIYLNEVNKLNLSICCVTRDSQKFLMEYEEFKSCTFVQWENADLKSLSTIDFVPDYILHLAADTSISNTAEEKALHYQNSVQGTKNLIKFLENKNPQGRILFASSGVVYSTSADMNKFSEKSSINASDLQVQSAYAAAKRSNEDLLIQSNLDIIITRPFAFAGPFLPMNGHFALGNFIESVLNHETIVIQSTGMDSRTYMYCADLVIWLISILLYGKSKEVYNVGSDEVITIKDLALKINHLGKGKGVEILNQTNVNTLGTNFYIPNVDKAKKELGLQRKYSLDKAIIRTLDYCKLVKLYSGKMS
jgi:nucleoside-diphosphate-sugar epimerase